MCWGLLGGLKPQQTPTGQRVKYVVTAVEQAATYYDRAGTPTESAWVIKMRRADQGSTPAYVYNVAQRADLPAPAQNNAILELDPRLVDVEPGG